MLTAQDIRGVCALVTSPATPDGGSAKATKTFNRDAFAKIVEDRIREGVDIIATTGTAGEGHTLLWEEHKELIATAVEVVNKRVPLFTGTTSLNTREIIEKTKYATDAGADGVLNGVPMWLAPSWQNAVQCYRDLAEACPRTAIMVYHNPFAFRVTIPPPGWVELAKIPQVVAAKQTVSELNHFMGVLRAVEDKISVLASDNNGYPTMMFGARGLWSTRASMGAGPVVALYRACKNGDWEAAKRIQNDIVDAGYTRKITIAEFHIYDAAIVKTAINAALDGLAGPIRPPFVHLPQHVEQAAIEVGLQWKGLCEKYTTVS